MNFESLVGHINQVQDVLQAQAAHAVNLSLTARNWLVGYYIVEFEQNGEDRAKYGDNLINRLAKEIGRRGFEPRRLREYRQVYIVYPQLGVAIESYLQKNSQWVSSSGVIPIWQTASAKLQTPIAISSRFERSQFCGIRHKETGSVVLPVFVFTSSEAP